MRKTQMTLAILLSAPAFGASAKKSQAYGRCITGRRRVRWPTPQRIGQARLAIGEFPPDSGRWGEAPWLALIAADSASGQDADARADLQTFLATSRTWSTMTAIEKCAELRRLGQRLGQTAQRRTTRAQGNGCDHGRHPREIPVELCERVHQPTQ